MAPSQNSARSSDRRRSRSPSWSRERESRRSRSRSRDRRRRTSRDRRDNHGNNRRRGPLGETRPLFFVWFVRLILDEIVDRSRNSRSRSPPKSSSRYSQSNGSRRRRSRSSSRDRVGWSLKIPGFGHFYLPKLFKICWKSGKSFKYLDIPDEIIFSIHNFSKFQIDPTSCRKVSRKI